MALANGDSAAVLIRQELCNHLTSQNYAQALKALERLHNESGGDETSQLLCNRAYCYEKLQLNRKALKDYEAALRKDPSNMHALVRQGKVLHALKRTQEAIELWKRAADADLLASDVSLVMEAQALIKDPDAAAAADAAAASPAPAAAPPPAATSPSPAALAPGQPTASTATEVDKQSAHVANGHASPKTAATTCAKAKARNQLPHEVMALLDRDPTAAVSLAVSQINEGKVAEAEGLLDRVLECAPQQAKLGAYVARGTARALSRELHGAVDDFSKAIAMEPRYADCWKRRGQARAALGETEAALQDLRKASDLTADRMGRADCLFECGMLLQKQKDYQKAAEVLESATWQDPRHAQAVNMLGLCYTSQGDLKDGIAAYEKALRLDPGLKDAWSNLAIAHKEIGHVKEAEKAFAHSIKARGDRESAVAMRMVGELRRGLGDHMGAIAILDRALAAHPPMHHQIELLFLRGACYHALGYHRSAARDYSQACGIQHVDTSNETKTQQFLAFYQRELVMYAYHNLDRPLASYFLDKDISPVFKESWCKKGPPPPELLTTYALQPHFPGNEPRPPSPPDTAKVALLVREADLLGDKLRYRHQGFLANVRQLRMGGLAAIELAQTLRAALKHQRAGMPLRVSNDGASGESSASGSHLFGWRDAMDILVRWRQLSEPNDQVLWVDLLTKAEFQAGFGSHTPIFSGQTKCVRYYMNFGRALGVFKDVLLRVGQAFDAHNIAVPLDEAKRKKVKTAQTAEDLWRAIGVDSWVVVPIASVSRPGHDLEGTRLTVVRVGDVPNGYEVSIRTPVTPPRWEDYDQELTAAWGALTEALAADDHPEIARRTLHYAYYWYNFMPLARGSAVVGAMTILAVFLAAGMPIAASIPPGYQTDWEAILSQSVDPFIESVSAWLYSPQARGEDAPAGASPFAPLDDLPCVADLLGTMRARLEALNGPELARIHTDSPLSD